MTQEHLAEQAGISARAVSDLERGENRFPRRDTLDLLADALRLSPDDRSTLEQTISRTRATPDAQGTPSPSSEHDGDAPDTLPAQPTAFIGREREVEAVRARLLDPETRLLTLTGPGGVGKTRLSLRVAAVVRAAFADGVAFVPLAAISDPDLVLSTIARTLDVREAPGQSIDETLAAALRSKRLLLVLDNFEQVLTTAPLIAGLLAAAPCVKALVTSRAALRVRGERAHPVASLTVPTPPLPSLEALSQYESVRLFIARAQDAVPDFAITNETAPAVAEICARLDGLPLAIELAAARTRFISPDALLGRLSSRLKVVTGGARDLPARQQTLRAAIDWSYDLLDPGEQTLFARLAVFVGGRTLEAVEAVCDVASDLPIDLFDGVESLVDKSLLRREVGAGGEPRLVMLETIHEYARERLDGSGERAAMERAHAAYYMTLGEKAKPGLEGPEQAQWLASLMVEHDNMRAALAWTLDADQPESALRISSALWPMWLMHGHLSEGRRWMDRVIGAAATAGLGGAMVAQALNETGALSAEMGAYDEAEAAMMRSLALYREVGDERGRGIILTHLGNVAGLQFAYERANAFYEQGLAIHRARNDPSAVAHALGNLAELAYQQGDIERASAAASESLALATTSGNIYFATDALSTLGGVALLRGDVDGAAWAYGGALEHASHLDNVAEMAENLEGLAVVALRREQPERAALLLGAAAAARAAKGAPGSPQNRATTAETLVAVRDALAVEVFSGAWSTGQQLPLDDVVATALQSL